MAKAVDGCSYSFRKVVPGKPSRYSKDASVEIDIIQGCGEYHLMVSSSTTVYLLRLQPNCYATYKPIISRSWQIMTILAYNCGCGGCCSSSWKYHVDKRTSSSYPRLFHLVAFFPLSTFHVSDEVLSSLPRLEDIAYILILSFLIDHRRTILAIHLFHLPRRTSSFHIVLEQGFARHNQSLITL